MLMYNFKEIAAPFDGINSSYDIFNSIKVSIDLQKRINMMRFDKQCVNFSKKSLECQILWVFGQPLICV